ncbi:GNAT family N-acetyltransferase [Deinococcus arenicola]|uniref:GNAT family N-acetyltransferase n=1 Tax=Deinococcus arenicola TaxID=2994950 RepID=A0ABU4DNS5_9DEIO|nr:GNAT family N-acetyltransferase [Deinococcus sp. ZS9-10]MDV6373754.1 GNAT family N-acetyltransferase [Deinococcus sp. ZS9-10]
MLHLAPALTPQIAALLGRAMYPDPARIDRTLEAYRTEDHRQLFAWEVDGQTVSAAGLRVSGRTAEILHIGTHPDAVGRGYGRELVHAIAAHLKLAQLMAETDDESVEFYRCSGFKITEAPARGERRRSLCTLTCSPIAP